MSNKLLITIFYLPKYYVVCKKSFAYSPLSDIIFTTNTLSMPDDTTPVPNPPTPPADQAGPPVPPPPPPRPKTSNDEIFQRFLVHPLTTFDETSFMNLLEHSLSLSTFEKKRVIDAIPTLSQFQVDELIKVFEDERVEFRKLMPTEGEIIKGLVVKAQNEWEQLKDIYTEEMKAQVVANADAQKAEDLKKSLGL